MKNLAIIPARSGSKGLKDKNILPLNGIPLLAYSIQAAKESNIFDEIMVSTDSADYANIAVSHGASVPFLRSHKNSSDTASSWDLVIEVLLAYASVGRYFDTVCLLQPTSPLRTKDDIISAYALFSEKNAEAITSVCEVDHSPLWATILPDDLSLSEFRRNTAINVPRQQLKKYYRLNGAIYIRSIEYQAADIILKSDKEFAFIMNKKNSIDIDTQDDFDLANYYLNRQIT